MSLCDERRPAAKRPTAKDKASNRTRQEAKDRGYDDAGNRRLIIGLLVTVVMERLIERGVHIIETKATKTLS